MAKDSEPAVAPDNHDYGTTTDEAEAKNKANTEAWIKTHPKPEKK